MKLYNTLTKQLGTVKPLDGKVTRIYSCGPTVYDHIHIGNLSSFIFADTLRRAVGGSGESVQHVMNFTDVDDKTIRRSHERYPSVAPKEALDKLTSEYSQVFLEDMAAVGNDVKAIQFIKATDSITAMQQLIKQLREKGFAYLAEDGVYFSIEAYRKSGKTYGQLTDITTDSTSETRIQNDEYDKESVHDFALWKKQKPGEPAWEFEIDGQNLTGRPGWHIECSAMSSSQLGQPFDIHTGGVDLIFPHHENEIAQSTAGRDDPVYASVFAHNEHLLVDGQKMSKSLNNIYTLKNITDKGYEPLAFRLLVLQSHYKNQAHFSWDNLQAAQNRLRRFQAVGALRWQARNNLGDASTYILKDVPGKLLTFMADDLDTPGGLAYLNDVFDQISTVLVDSDANNPYNSLEQLDLMLQGVDLLLGLGLSEIPDITDQQKQLIADREAAREAQDWKASDELRKQLETLGIGIRDTAYGAIWHPL